MRVILYYLRPFAILLMAILLFVAGFKLGGFWSFILYVLGTFFFGRWYTYIEIRGAMRAYIRDEEHQIGFTNRNGFGKMMLHLFIAALVFILVAVFVERVQMQALAFACIPVLAMSFLFNMYVIDKKLKAGFDEFLRLQEEVRKEHERQQKLLDDLNGGSK